MPSKASDKAPNHFSLEVQNISTKPLLASVLICPDPDSEIPSEEVILTSATPANSDKPWKFFAPMALEAKGISILEGTISFTPHPAERHSTVNLKTTLSLQSKHLENSIPVQHIESMIDVTTPFFIPQNTEHLLVTNRLTKGDEIVGWTKIIAGIGYSAPAVWNVSNRGDLHPSALTADFANKTVIILNNRVQSEGEKVYHTVDRIARNELFDAMKNDGIKLYVIGAPTQTISDYQIPEYHSSIPLIQKSELIPRLREGNGPLSFMFYSKIKKNKSSEQRSRPKLINKADDIAEKLLKEFPQKRYIVCHKYSPSHLLNMIGCSTKIGIGTVLVYEDLPKDQASVAIWNLDQSHISHPEYNISHHTYNLLKLESFEKKMALIPNDVEQQSEERSLAKAILSDLVDEMYCALKGGSDFRKLHQLCETPVESTQQKKYLLQILLQLTHLVSKQGSAKDMLLPTVHHKIAKEIVNTVKNFKKEGPELSQEERQGLKRTAVEENRKAAPDFEDDADSLFEALRNPYHYRKDQLIQNNWVEENNIVYPWEDLYKPIG